LKEGLGEKTFIKVFSPKKYRNNYCYTLISWIDMKATSNDIFNKRRAGILMPIFSLPNKYGIGSFGQSAFDFINFLVKSGFGIWQILPLNPTGFGDSPFSSPNSFVLNPYFIDLEILADEGLLKKEELKVHEYPTSSPVCYLCLYNTRLKLLKKAYRRFIDKNNVVIGFCEFLEQTALKQWLNLKNYANKNGVLLFGDMPLYVAQDSIEYKRNSNLFLEGLVAGCPPDDFSSTGQLWGNPVYDWEKHKNDNYSWWIRRIAYNLQLFDAIRIDHFRGLDEFYSIDKNATNAIHGKWLKGGGKDFIKTINEQLNNPPLFAEDLGYITDSVRELLEFSGYLGMRVLQFGLSDNDPNSYHLSDNYPKNCIAYSGTHDNDTALGFYKKQSSETKTTIKKILNISNSRNIGFAAAKSVLLSKANIAIIPIQDFLNLDSNYRTNTPATVGNHNWSVRICSDMLTDKLADKIKEVVVLSGRCMSFGEKLL